MKFVPVTQWAGLAAVALLIALPSSSDDLRAQSGPGPDAVKAPLVAIGDVHGDQGSFLRLLASLDLIDDEARWIGGKRRLVQTGDLLDRGAHSRRSVELLMRLEKEAQAAGGKVTVLMGNHELMNLTGDMRYVSRAEFNAFRAAETAKLRGNRRAEILGLIRKPSSLIRSRYYATLSRTLNERSFDTQFPAGFFALREEYSPRGKLGTWLLSRQALHVEKDILFLHGGLSPRWANKSPEKINKEVQTVLKNYFALVAELEKKGVFHHCLGPLRLQDLMDDERRLGGPAEELEEIFKKLDRCFSSIVFASDGPFWYRGLAENSERAFQQQLSRILQLQSVQRIVVGHTQHPSLTIQGRFGNRVILIDTGMNQEAYGGKPSALLIHSSSEISIHE